MPKSILEKRFGDDAMAIHTIYTQRSIGRYNYYGGYNLENRESVIKGTVILKHNHGTTINIEGHCFFSEIEVNEQEGEDVYFKATRERGHKLKLRYIPKVCCHQHSFKLGVRKEHPSIQLSEDVLGLQLSAFLQSNENEQTSIKDIQKKLNTLMNQVTSEDVKYLFDEKYHPLKMTLESLYSLVNKNKQQMEVLQIDEETWLEREVKKYEHIYGKSEEVKAIIKKLKSHHLPVNVHNIEKIQEAVTKFNTCATIDDYTITQMIKNKTPLTLNNVYKAKYSSGQSKSKADDGAYTEESIPISDEQLKGLEPQIRNLLEQQGISVEDKTLKAARLLIKNNIPVDKNNIEQALSLSNISNTIDINSIIEKAVQYMKEDRDLGDILLIKQELENISNPSQIKRLVNEIDQYKDEQLAYLILNSQPLTLKNLGLLKQSFDVNAFINDNYSPAYIEAKNQLQEIRLKMTFDAAIKLTRNNVDIENDTLDTLVMHLRQLENDVYRSKLKEAGAIDNKQTIHHLKETIQQIESVKHIPTLVLGRILLNETAFSLRGLNTNGKNLLVALSEAQVMYETLGTKPRTDMGDSIFKAYGQLDHILLEQNIEVTEDNLRAARILSYNGLEITDNQIEHIKLIDKKVNRVLNELHPTIIAAMIKDKYIPIDMPIDEVLEYLSQFDTSKGEDLNDKLSHLILELDQQKQLSPKERQGLIGVYRMLHVITQSEGRAVGFLVKNKMKLTLNNLMEAAKYLQATGAKRTKIDVTIDEAFGYLSELKVNDKNINQIIKNAFTQAGLEYTKNNVSQALALQELQVDIDKNTLIQGQSMEETIEAWIQSIDSERLQQVMKENDAYGEQSLEDMIKQYFLEQEVKGNTNNSQDIVQHIQQLDGVKEAVLREMIKYDIPLTIRHISTMQSMVNKPFELSERLEKLLGHLDEKSRKTLHTLLKQPLDNLENIDLKSINKTLEKHLNQLKTDLLLSPDTSTDQLRALDSALEVFNMQGTIQLKENYYPIPIVTDDSTTQLNMYILKDLSDERIEKEGIHFILSLKTNELGRVRMLIHKQEQTVNITVTSDQQENTDFIKQYENHFTQILEDLQVVGTVLFALDNPEAENGLLPITTQRNEVSYEQNYRQET